VLISVAFLTLYERKILRYTQTRKGPNKASILGVLQPISDIIKLFTKFSALLNTVEIYMFIVRPLIILILLMLCVCSLLYPAKSFTFSLIFIVLVLSLNRYPVLFIGVSRKSRYAWLGGIRVIRQIVSYEVSLIILLLFFFLD